MEEEEKSLTSLQTVQFQDVSFIAQVPDQTEFLNEQSLSESDGVRTKNKQCRNDLSINSENGAEMSMEESTDCQESDKELKTQGLLKNRLQNHNLKQNFECNLCGKIFKRNSILRAHQREVHSVAKRYSCPECNYATNNKTNYDTHFTIRHLDVNKNGIKCESCDKKCFRKEDLTRHKIKEHNAPRFKCNVCDKSYTSKQYLRIHSSIHKPDFKFEHQCVECGKMFPNGGRLSSHVRKKHSGFQFKCSECGKGMSSPACLRDHMTLHTGDKPYKCDVCGKTFATRKYLSVHARTHSGEKPYTCKECDKSFTQKSSLSVHIRRYHIDVKPYTCDVCLKGFVTNTLLRNHMKGHKT